MLVSQQIGHKAKTDLPLLQRFEKFGIRKSTTRCLEKSQKLLTRGPRQLSMGRVQPEGSVRVAVFQGSEVALLPGTLQQGGDEAHEAGVHGPVQAPHLPPFHHEGELPLAEAAVLVFVKQQEHHIQHARRQIHVRNGARHVTKGGAIHGDPSEVVKTQCRVHVCDVPHELDEGAVIFEGDAARLDWSPRWLRFLAVSLLPPLRLFLPVLLLFLQPGIHVANTANHALSLVGVQVSVGEEGVGKVQLKREMT